MRKELKMIGSKDRHIFTAIFIRFGFRDGYKGSVETILLQDVLLNGKVVTDHLWFDLTKDSKAPICHQAMWLSSAQGLVFTRKDIKDTGMTYLIDR